MRTSDTPKIRPSKRFVAGLLALACTSCIPSFPPCDCNKADDGDNLGDFPDFDVLDRSVECNLGIPLPDAEDDAVCGYPEGPYGYSVGDVFENLELFDCEGNQVQIAQYLPQEGLPEIETRGVVFGLGAIWCDPCRMEGEEWAAHFVDEYAGEIQFIQALDEGAAGSSVLPASCAGWQSSVADDKFPILYVEEVAGLRSKIEVMPNEPIPFTLIFNANAQVIFRETGGILGSSKLTTQIDTLLNDPYGN